MNTSRPIQLLLLSACFVLTLGYLSSCASTDSEETVTQISTATDAPKQPAHPAAHLADVTMPGWSPAELEEAMSFLDSARDWEDHGRPLDVPRHPAQKYLNGMIIVLDPGHGGMAHVAGYKRGPTGVREAEMNLRVAFLLRKLLEDAGATVTLTREEETSAAANDTLKETHFLRAEIANNHPRPDGGQGADIFISIHHNASSRPEANYPSVWFHGEADWSEPALDIAKYVGHRLGAELRCSEVGLTSVLMSDQQMYGSGFAVLRHSRVPAILLESSFFSHAEEEQRLRDAMYNLREAYALYVGLVEYAYGGRPTQTTPEVEVSEQTMTLTTTLSEALPEWWGHERQRTLTSTISVFVDGERINATFDPATKQITATHTFDASMPTELTVSVHHANMYKHHNWPQRYQVTADGEGGWKVEPKHNPYAGEQTKAKQTASVDP